MADMPMPNDSGSTGPAGEPVAAPPPPTPFGRQLAQLVVIPAVIVIVCVLVAILFGKLAGSPDSIDNQLLKLQQGSGGGRMPLGLQDPRYKERGLAAFNIAAQIRTIADPAERRRISDALIVTLREHVGPEEWYLHVYLLTAVGQLGEAGGLAAIEPWLAASLPQSRQGAIRGLLSWPREDEARRAVPALVKLLSDVPAVAAEAAAALGELAQRGDEPAVGGLRAVLGSTGVEQREVRWNAGVALARLGDEAGAAFVADVLLNREALGRMGDAEAGPAAQQPMSAGAQDRIMLATLAGALDMTDERVWDKIRGLAESDSNLAVQAAARQLLDRRAAKP